MEPSEIFGEECHSSESGWTMYIGSPFYGDDENEHNDHHGKNYDDDDDDDKDGSGHDGDRDKGCNHEDDSDDSMASDASSGPSHQGTTNLKHEDVKEGNGSKSQVKGGQKGSSEPRGKKKIDDMRRRSNEEEKKREKVVMGKRDVDNASAHQSGSTKVSVQYSWDAKADQNRYELCFGDLPLCSKSLVYGLDEEI